MKSLRTSARITEVADTATRLLILYKRETALANDAILKPLFTELTTLADQLSEVIKSDRAVSELDAADSRRDEVVRRMDKILQGYAAMPIEALQKSGERLNTIFAKYGVKITRENYAVESAHIESLLKDFADPALAADIQALTGVPEIIDALKTAQNVFNERRVTYEQELALQNIKLKSTELKKRILERINVSLLAYLTSVKSIKNEQYTHFIEGVSQIIADTNSAIIARGKKPENNTPPATA